MKKKRTHVVIIGGGFGGLYTAKNLANSNIRVTLIDRRNFHLFQPLLYQVATGSVSPGDISSPIRSILASHRNIHVIQDEVIQIDPHKQIVILKKGSLAYDKLVVATGVRHHYFGNDHWEDHAGGLKTIEDALKMRRRILTAFEEAERTHDPRERQKLMTFVVVGGGPTGVELAGALGELAHRTLRDDFRSINPNDVRIYLVEGQERILANYPPRLSAKAKRSVEQLGVTVLLKTRVTHVSADSCILRHNNRPALLPTATILWAAGIKASSLGAQLAQSTGCQLDNAGRVKIRRDLSIPHYPNISIIGDLAHYVQDDKQLPGVAQVAMQMGKYTAEKIKKRQHGEKVTAFKYQDRGSLAVIGRNKAVANLFGLELNGFPAWLVWAIIHISYLIEFDNRLKVIIQWASDYFMRRRGVRLITGDQPS